MSPRLERVVRQTLDDRFSSTADLAAAIVAAVLDELQLTEERRPRGLHRCDDPALKYEESRLVSPWVRAEEQR